MKAAKRGAGDLGAPPQAVGAARSSEAGLSGPEDLARPFPRLGMTYDMVGMFVPAILHYIQSMGGADLMSLPRSAVSE